MRSKADIKSRAKIPDETIEYIKQLIEQGQTTRAIARKTSVSTATVSRIKQNMLYAKNGDTKNKAVNSDFCKRWDDFVESVRRSIEWVKEI